MAKSKVSEWDEVAGNNIIINGINIGENCPPSAVNNAIREMMAQIKQWQSGSTGDDWISNGTLDITGTLRLDGSLGSDGQVLSSKGSTETPVWTTLGSMSNQNSSSVNITGGSVKTTGDLNVTGSLKLDSGVGSSGQVLSSKGTTATPVWKTLPSMTNQNSNDVNITGGTITGLSNLTATTATFTNTNTTGSVKYDNNTGSVGQVLTSQGGATPIWKAVSATDGYTKAQIDATQAAQDTKIAANTSKKTNATHTGDVTGDGYLTIGTGKVTNHKLATNSVTSVKIASNAVDNAKIKANAVKANELFVSGNGTATQYLRSDGDGTFTWDTPPDTKVSNTLGGIGAYSGYSSLYDVAPGSIITIGSQTWRVMGITGKHTENIAQTRTYYLIIRLT